MLTQPQDESRAPSILRGTSSHMVWLPLCSCKAHWTLKTLPLNWSHVMPAEPAVGSVVSLSIFVPQATGLHHQKPPLPSRKLNMTSQHQPRDWASTNTLNGKYGYFQPAIPYLPAHVPLWVQSTKDFLKLSALLTLSVFCNAFFLHSESLNSCFYKTKQCPPVARAPCPQQRAHLRTSGGLSVLSSFTAVRFLFNFF